MTLTSHFRTILKQQPSVYEGFLVLISKTAVVRKCFFKPNSCRSFAAMAFIRVEKKKSGTCLRIVHSYKENGKPKHKTLHSLGKVEDYAPHQLEAIAKKPLELSGVNIENIIADSFRELGRYDYGYAIVIKKLWEIFNIKSFI